MNSAARLRFGDLGFSGHSDSRYSLPKWAQNQFRALLSNNWNGDKEPSPSSDAVIPGSEFLPMVRTTFGHVSDDDFLAVLKRYTTIVVGHNAVYVRPPSKDPEAVAYRFAEGNVHDDLLQDNGHNMYFGKWKVSENVEYDGYLDAVDTKQDMMRRVCEETANLTDEQDIVSWWVDKAIRRFGAGGATSRPPPAARGQRGAGSGPASSVADMPAKEELAEELTDAELAQIFAKQEQLAASGVIQIEVSPPNKRLKLAMPKTGFRGTSDMDDPEVDPMAAVDAETDLDFDLEKALEELVDEMVAEGLEMERVQMGLADDREKSTVVQHQDMGHTKKAPSKGITEG